MRWLVLLDTAVDDIDDVHRHIARQSGSAEVGLKFTDQLIGQCEKLAALPGTLGRAVPQLRPDLRSFPFKAYVILFRYRDGEFEVTRIVEGHRDLDRLFS